MKIHKKLLSEVAEVIAGQSPPSDCYNKNESGLPFYQGKTDFGEKYPIVRNWCTGTKNKEAIANDILISVRAPVGPVNLCQNKSIIGRGLSAIRAKKGNSFEYLYYFLKNNEQQIAKLGTGSTFKAITQTHLNKIIITVPEKYEDQIRIADVLTRAEKLIAKRKESIKSLDEFLKSTFLEMFGDPVRNEKGWEKVFLGDVTNLITDGKHGDSVNEENSGYYFISAKDIHDGIIDYTNARQIIQKDFEEVHRRTDLCPGDLVIVNTGATIGKLAIVTNDHRTHRTTFQKSVAVVKIKENLIDVNYLKFLFGLRLRDLVKASSGSAQQNLLLSQMRKIIIILPSVQKQSKFAAIVEKVEAIKVKYNESLVEMEKLYGGLSQRAFRGEL
jgi:type I restriction enzyme S subunit